MRSTTHTPIAITLRVPTLNDSLADFINLFRLWQEVQACGAVEVVFNFSDCRFLRQNAVAFLGGLARLIGRHGGKVVFDWSTLQSAIYSNLAQNGFCAAVEGRSGGWQGNSIPYREDPHDSLNEIANYLDTQWLGRGWVEVDENIKNEIVCTLLEIYSNAFEHGCSEIGVFSCGQRYPSLNTLKLTVIDFGIGIPHNVRNFLRNPTMLAADTLNWAFQAGRTTRSPKIPGGTGLDTLKRFIKAKQGKIEIYSHDGYVLIDKTQEIYQGTDTCFEGTLINITVQCDIGCYT